MCIANWPVDFSLEKRKCCLLLKSKQVYYFFNRYLNAYIFLLQIASSHICPGAPLVQNFLDLFAKKVNLLGLASTNLTKIFFFYQYFLHSQDLYDFFAQYIAAVASRFRHKVHVTRNERHPRKKNVCEHTSKLRHPLVDNILTFVFLPIF